MLAAHWSMECNSPTAGCTPKTNIWNHHVEPMNHTNRIVWNDATETIQDICERAGSLLTNWQNAQLSRNIRPSPTTNQPTWVCPVVLA
jgi:hypothetical protein